MYIRYYKKNTVSLITKNYLSLQSYKNYWQHSFNCNEPWTDIIESFMCVRANAQSHTRTPHYYFKSIALLYILSNCNSWDGYIFLYNTYVYKILCNVLYNFLYNTFKIIIFFCQQKICTLYYEHYEPFKLWYVRISFSNTGDRIIISMYSHCNRFLLHEYIYNNYFRIIICSAHVRLYHLIK